MTRTVPDGDYRGKFRHNDNRNREIGVSEMPEISASTVMKLRKMSGQGMMDCKKALAETDGECGYYRIFAVARLRLS